MHRIYHPIKWVVWALAALFYFYEFLIRVAPTVMVSELMSAFGVTATAIGTLSAFYFFTYGPLQLPVGILTDRYGARKLLALASLIAGLGSLLFAIAQEYWVAALGRCFMGIGSAFAFVCMIYISSHWFKESKRGILIGLANGAGMIGAIMGEGPLRLVMHSYGWRLSLFGLGLFGVFLALFIYLLVRNGPQKILEKEVKNKKRPIPIRKKLSAVCHCHQNWLVAMVSLFSYVATPGFAGLWGIPFIHNLYNISIELSGFAVSMIFVGWAIGGPLFGQISDRLKTKKPILIFSGVICAFLIAWIIYIPNLPLPLLFTLLFLLGLVSGAQLLTYGYAIDVSPDFAKATSTAFTNFVAIMGSAVMQMLIGILLDLQWTGNMAQGVRVYSDSAYILAMTCFPICFLISAFLSLFLQKKTKKPRS